MQKSILLIVLYASLTFAGSLNLSLSSAFQQGDKWNISMEKDRTYYVMLPIDVEFSKLQESLLDGENLYVYRWYQSSDLFKADFGVKSLVIVNVKKSSVDYNVYNPTEKKYKMVGHNFSDVKTYLTKTIAPLIDNSAKKSIFLNSYVPSLSKMDKNKLYLIKPKSSNLNISISLSLSGTSSSTTSSSEPASSSSSSEMSSSSSSEASSEPASSSSSSTGLETPPSVPDLNTSTGSSSSTGIETPPAVPTI